MSTTKWFMGLLLLLPATADAGKARKDLHGDPLPQGALARMGSTRFRTGGGFGSVVYSPDGKWIAYGSGDFLIRLCDPHSGREIRRLPGYASFWAVSPDGKILASNNVGLPLFLWDTAKGKRLLEIDPGRVYAAVFSHDGKMLATGNSSHHVRLWNVATGKLLRIFGEHKGEVFSISFSPDDRWLASGDETNKRACLWDVKTGALVREFRTPRAGVTIVRFAPNGNTLAIGCVDGMIHLYDAASGKQLWQNKGHTYRVTGLLFTPDGKTLISAGDDSFLRMWNAANGKPIRQLGQHRDQIYGLCLSQDGKTVVSAGLDSVIRRWDLAAGKEIAAPAGHEHRITSVRFSRDGKTLISEAFDGTRRVWDAATGKELRRQDGVAATHFSAAALSADGRTLAVADEKTVRLRDTATGKQRSLPAVSDRVHTFQFSEDGRILAGTTNASILHLWDTAPGTELCRMSEKSMIKNHLVFSPDGRLFAKGGFGPDGKDIHLWDTSKGKEIRRIAIGHQASLAMCFSADGRMLAGWSGDPYGREKQEHELIVWETATGGELVRFRGHLWGIHSAAFSPDGRTLASGDWRQTVCVWDLFTGKERQRLRGEQGLVGAMCFSADGSRLACGGENTTILTWPIAPAPALPIVTLSTEQLQSRWADLTDPDAGRAFRSMTALHATPRQTLDLLRGHLHPVPAPDAARVKRWIAELDSDVFAVRQKATKELGKCGDAIEGALRQALAGKPSLEARRRMEDLLAKMTADTPERLRTVRALELLEGMHTTAAWQLLDELAHGAPSTWLTREAKAALHRVRAASTWQ